MLKIVECVVGIPCLDIYGYEFTWTGIRYIIINDDGKVIDNNGEACYLTKNHALKEGIKKYGSAAFKEEITEKDKLISPDMSILKK